MRFSPGRELILSKKRAGCERSITASKIGTRAARPVQIVLWPEPRVRFRCFSCPDPRNSYIYAAWPARVQSKNDSRLGKSEVYEKQTNDAQVLRRQGFARIVPRPEENGGSRPAAKQQHVVARERPTRGLLKSLCGSRLASIFANSTQTRQATTW